MPFDGNVPQDGTVCKLLDQMTGKYPPKTSVFEDQPIFYWIPYEESVITVSITMTSNRAFSRGSALSFRRCRHNLNST